VGRDLTAEAFQGIDWKEYIMTLLNLSSDVLINLWENVESASVLALKIT
jgi:hypothetical protein